MIITIALIFSVYTIKTELVEECWLQYDFIEQFIARNLYIDTYRLRETV